MARSYLSAPAPLLGGDDFTFEAWVNLDAAQVSGSDIAPPLWILTPGNFWGGNVFIVYPYRGDHPYVTVWLNDYSGSVPMLIGADIRGAGWTHVALTKQEDLWTLWINGQAAATRTFAFAFTYGTNWKQFVGGDMLGYSGDPLVGLIDELRVTRNLARYTANFTPPDAPFTPKLPANAQLRVTLSSTRDGLKSTQEHDWTMRR